MSELGSDLQPKSHQLLSAKCLVTLSFIPTHTVFFIILPYYSTCLYIIAIVAILSCFMDAWLGNRYFWIKVTYGIVLGVFPSLVVVTTPVFSLLGFALVFLCFFFVTIMEDKSIIVMLHGITSFASWIIAFILFIYHPRFYQDPNIALFINNEPIAYQLLLCALLTYPILVYGAYDRFQVASKRKEYERQLLELNASLQNANKQLQAALDEKENFILRFSHEIRNPLNSLLGNVELLMDSAVDEKSRDMLNDAKICGEILLQLLNNVLDTAKVASGQLEVSINTYNIREFLENLWVVASEIIRKKKLYGSMSLSISTPEWLDFDKHRLMQIMINLVSNASKFTDEGYVKLRVDFLAKDDLEEEDMYPKYFLRDLLDAEVLPPTTHHHTFYDTEEFIQSNQQFLSLTNKKFSKRKATSTELDVTNSQDALNEAPNSLSTTNNNVESKGFIRIEVIDSGCGMSSDQMDVLFEKFAQVNEEGKKRQIGTGLGLWITKELIELMNGNIKVYSAPGSGTCFVITLESHSRVVDPNAESSIKLSGTSTSSPLQNCLRRYLVVEDSPYNQEINRKFLEKCNADEIMIANNGLEGVEIFKANPEGYFTCIFMDLDMPIMDGKIACQKIREYERQMDWKPVKIAILTAYSQASTQKELLSQDGFYRADIFLSKPTTFAVILKTINDFTSAEENYKSKKVQNQEKNKKTIMVVDDDHFNLKMIKECISKLGYNCLYAETGVEAIEMFKLNPSAISLILMDCEMPQVDGFEATEKIVKIKQGIIRGNDPQIFGLTGHVHDLYKIKAQKSGMKDLLTKPITFAQLKKLFDSELRI